ncbi:hypothetical protein C9I92_24900 [Photobacterium ganghwense]|uniref:Uncharacterized protein n=1 Tax=Photobacterium ganghwense TaxID=320778 RepID=A0A0J1GUY9_9GAMM|nr:hypothetical protein [Photobacterium ganghwense]KLV03568.1 hypothetical protein ABT57_24545 [Photobacterium ganghwense]PSU03516.1 hypothetical protein C9I92_24900 [Photobacterium ganghwense]
MKVKDLQDKLAKLDPESELFCFTENGNKFHDANRAYMILGLELRKGYKIRQQTESVDASFTENDEGENTAILLISSDF